MNKRKAKTDQTVMEGMYLLFLLIGVSKPCFHLFALEILLLIRILYLDPMLLSCYVCSLLTFYSQPRLQDLQVSVPGNEVDI